MEADLRYTSYLAALRCIDDWSVVVKSMNAIVSADPGIARDVLTTYRQDAVTTMAWVSQTARAAVVYLRSVYAKKNDETWLDAYIACDNVLRRYIQEAITADKGLMPVERSRSVVASMITYDIRYIFPGGLDPKPLPLLRNNDPAFVDDMYVDEFRGFTLTLRVANVRLSFVVMINEVERRVAEYDEVIAKALEFVATCSCRAVRRFYATTMEDIVQREVILEINQHYDIQQVSICVLDEQDSPVFVLDLESEHVQPTKLLDASWKTYLESFGKYLPIGDALGVGKKHAVALVSDILREMIMREDDCV